MSDFVCNLDVWGDLNNHIRDESGIDLEEALNRKKKHRKDALLYAARHKCEDPVLYSITEYDEMIDCVQTVHLFTNATIPMEQLENLTRLLPSAEFGVIYPDHTGKLFEKVLAEELSKHIVPITLRDANSFVTAHHRHHDSVTGCKFAVGLCKTVNGEDRLIGVAICGRPVSRMLDDGYTLEINRLCVTEDGNCCSMLYGACCRIAKEMGYRKIVTYILQSESGVSLKASNFRLEDDCCGGANWTGSRKRKDNAVPEEMKQRWIRILSAS